MGKELDFDKLKGSENFHTWRFAMQNFLALKGYTNCIKHRDDTAATSTTAKIVHAADIATETDNTKLESAKAYLALGVDTSIYVHIHNCTTGLDIWNTLHRLYEDKGLYRKIGLLGSLLSNKLEDSDGMQDYVDKIANAANKLSGVGFPVNDEWLGAILLAGLTDEFKPFIMGLEANGVGISGDLIISKLLDCRDGNDRNSALYSKKFDKKSKKKQRKCFNCGSPQHLANACDQPKKAKPTEKSARAAFMMALSSTDECNESEDDESEAQIRGFLGTNNKNVWFVDSGGSRHVTPYSDFIGNRNNEKDKITAANGENLKITGTGDGKVTFANGNVSVQRIMHVPDLAVNLLSVSQIVKSGNTVVFDSEGCSIYNNDNKCVLFCKEKGGVYAVEADDKKCFIAAHTTSAYTWHRRLGHANYSVMKKMRAGAVEGVNFKDDDSKIENCETCSKAKKCSRQAKRNHPKYCNWFTAT